MSNCLIFEFDATRYAISAEHVISLYWLPELSPIDSAPNWIVGMLNLHDKIIPVLDLGLRLGHPPRPYRTDNIIILLEVGDHQYGLIVDSIHDLVDVPEEEVSPTLDFDQTLAVRYRDLFKGEAKFGDEILMLFDARALLHGQIQGATEATACNKRFKLDQPTDDNRNLLHDRMHRLAQPLLDEGNELHEAYVLIMIGGACYAIESAYVVEFTHLRHYTPLPCCPPHILGGMNLRGDILTVIDLMPLLKLTDIGEQTEVVILHYGGTRLALAVQQIQDLHYVVPESISPLQEGGEQQLYCKALLHYGNVTASILDMQTILASDLLVVNEQV